MTYLSGCIARYGWLVCATIFFEALNFIYYVGLTLAVAINLAHDLIELRIEIFHFINPIVLLLVLSFAYVVDRHKTESGKIVPATRYILRDAAWAWYFSIAVVMAFDVFTLWDNARRHNDLDNVKFGNVSNQHDYWISSIVRLSLCLFTDVLTFFIATSVFTRAMRRTIYKEAKDLNVEMGMRVPTYQNHGK